MSYATPADMMAAFPATDLIQLTQQDPAAQTVDEARLQTQLDQASAFIDGYLQGRFSLPFTDPPGPPLLLKPWCMDIAMYRLQALRPLHDMADAKARYNDAIKGLTAVNQGKLSLGLTDSGETVAPSQPTVLTLPNGAADALVHSEAAASLGQGAMFTRGSLRSY
jgi:phage gp36-like protein